MKKRMIKQIALMLILVMMMGIGTTSFAGNKSLGQDVVDALKDVGSIIVTNTLKAISDIFKDVKQTDWFATTVGKLIDLGGINGYPDGTFKPNATITRGEFTKILVSALGHKDQVGTGSHWASGYVEKAISMRLTSREELKDLDKAMPRNEMAKMVANGLDYLGETHVKNRNEYKGQITDFSSIQPQYQDFVLKAYTKGIITGYTDGTFGGDKGLTRAEASTVILRIIEVAERKIPPTPIQQPITESGPDVDLNKVIVTSKASVDVRGPKGTNNPHNVDFSILLKTWEPLAPQHADVENVLIARFGKNNSTVNEIIKYIKTKVDRDKELPLKSWDINGQQISVVSSPGSSTIDLTVWRK